MGNNDGRAWSAPAEVAVTDMRRRCVIDKAKNAFYRDVCLRLERTAPRFAVRYDFADAKDAADYQRYVMNRMRKDQGTSFVVSSKSPSRDGIWHVYFARGPNYKK